MPSSISSSVSLLPLYSVIRRMVSDVTPIRLLMVALRARPQKGEEYSDISPNTEGKTKKGYMSVRLSKYRKIFGLYEDSFHDFKGCFFKIFPVGEHRPFWLSLEGQGRFPPYWSRDAGLEYVKVTYKGLSAD
ncbi:hypothetical protein PIB30_057186 [Stylosanthes scabra]|uniref:Uncharacterized protein n=1 Tax=Stylosanthes scabra TaxID=79078 RepID=A0ABU6SKT6_9FABA|nr:hypothetical protein [Stylosanthes scabra]